jgi:hypothetical protein
MTDLEAVFQAIDDLTPEERQQVLAYIEAQQTPVSTAKQPRTPGLFPGIVLHDDFDDELPDSFWLGEE